MPRTIVNARLRLTGIFVAWFGWMFTTGVYGTQLVGQALSGGNIGSEDRLALATTGLLTGLALLLLGSKLADLARQTHWSLPRIIGLTVLLYISAAGLGSLVHFDTALGFDLMRFLGPTMLLVVRLACGAAGLVLFLSMAPDESPSQKFFLSDRSHAANALARRSVWVSAGHAGLAILAIHAALGVKPTPMKPFDFPYMLFYLAVAYLGGISIVLIERYPQRASGFIPIGYLVSVLATIAMAVAPDAHWPILLLGVAMGMIHAPLHVDLLANVPARQGLAALLVLGVGQSVGFGLAYTVISLGSATGIGRVLLAVPFAALALWTHLREVLELLTEPLLAIVYRVRSAGPGAGYLPTRGPLLVIANHTAWFDPLWVAKVTPVRLRPMMTSRYYDLPLMSWLMRKVFGTIRVPAEGFRREAPEIKLAVEALQAGENVLIFPEGWMKRKEEQTVKRFGQGIVQILRGQPHTPVVACWIEGGWGTYTSYCQGPPTKNKPKDFFRLIRIGISEPVVLKPEVLADSLQTRRFLIKACLNARTHLGLPELPGPAFAGDDKEEEADG